MRLSKFRIVLKDCIPDKVIVHGDTSIMSAAVLATFYEKIPVVYVEVGKAMRSRRVRDRRVLRGEAGNASRHRVMVVGASMSPERMSARRTNRDLYGATVFARSKYP